MAVAAALQTIHDGARNLIGKALITSDTTDATAVALIDASTYSNPTPGVGASLKLMRVIGSLDNFNLRLLWDADTDVEFINIPTDYSDQDFGFEGGLINNSGTGITGDIKFSTNGIASGEDGSLILFMRKRDI